MVWTASDHRSLRFLSSLDCGAEAALIEVLALSIPTRNVVVLLTTWDILFGYCADGISEVLVCPVHIRCIKWQQALSELVG